MTHDLILLSEDAFWNIINERYLNQGGVYKIIAVRERKRVPINRFLGTDKEGVLYIGKAASFVQRLISLKRSISPDYNGSAHICGRRYKSNPNISKVFPYNILHIEFIQVTNPEEYERELLTTYANLYGEVPPLNAI